MKDAKGAIVVTVSDAALQDIQEVAKKLAGAGMDVTRVMPLTGVITGTYGRAKKTALAKVDGVSSVEEELGVQLAPPDAPVQ